MEIPTDTFFNALAATDDRKERWKLLHHLVQTVGERAFRRLAAQEIVSRANIHSIIPDAYQRYRRMVVDGIEFFLGHVEVKRLLSLIDDLLTLGPKSTSEELLVETARHFPTLQKLGQMIARNPHLDQRVKDRLITLENGLYGTSVETLLDSISRSQTLKHGENGEMVFEKEIIAEASVAAVVAFHYTVSDSKTIDGVCKILKPDIPEILEEELLVLDKTATFFEQERDTYQLHELNIRGLFEDLQETMQKEINLEAEQEHLQEADNLYKDNGLINIPKVYSLSTPSMTCMDYVPGRKITQVTVGLETARNIAQSLFEALICTPLYSTAPLVLFHGDPHAGNILLDHQPGSDSFSIGLVDWTLAGRLTLAERVWLSQLVQAVLKKNSREIAIIIEKLAADGSTPFPLIKSDLSVHIGELLNSVDFQNLSLIGTVFHLLEELSYKGLFFRADLMLFRKSLFTLEGVLLDIEPNFDIDAQMMLFITKLIGEEMPLRLNNLFFPLNDSSENYPSLISNQELQSLIFHQYTDFLFKSTATFWGVTGNREFVKKRHDTRDT